MDFFLVIFRFKLLKPRRLGFWIVIDCTGTLQTKNLYKKHYSVRRNYCCPRSRLEKPVSLCFSLKFVQSSHSLKFSLELFSKWTCKKIMVRHIFNAYFLWYVDFNFEKSFMIIDQHVAYESHISLDDIKSPLLYVRSLGTLLFLVLLYKSDWINDW